MRTIGTAALALLFSVAWTAPAGACGGTFCDSPPPGQPPMPVQQSGENVVFVLAQGHVEAHVQIQYTGDPARFAWLVPVPALPELSVGSQQLFTNLLNATVPRFQLSFSYDLCGKKGGRVSSGGCGFGAASSGSSVSDSANGATEKKDSETSTPDIVVSRQAVGAFDISVLRPGSAAEVQAWLDANGFLQADGAPAILQDYIDRGHLFVAVKLQPSTGVNEIHPLVIRYEGDEPCIPLKLTSIAANEDMGVRAFFLGDRRVVPTSYRHVALNPARLDWSGFNYESSISRAVDAKGADGHAFVTEYAGASSVVTSNGVFSAAWNADVFRSADPASVVSLLAGQGLVGCNAIQCTATHPLVMPIVRKYLPVPSGMSEGQFYGCLSCNAEKIDTGTWNGAAFADELEERVIGPGRHAADILAGNPYLTRLFTTISPFEMTEDPTFTTGSPGMPNVSALRSANINTTCRGQQVLEISGRKPIALSGFSIPTFDAKMPDALVVEEFDTQGKATLLYDNAATIDAQIDVSNRSVGYKSSSPASIAGAFGAALGLSMLRRFRRSAR